MGIKKILKMGHPLLREKSISLTTDEILCDETKQLIQDLVETMENANGLGLAAPQIGVLKQVAVIKLSQNNPRYQIEQDSETFIIFNPTIKILESPLQGYWEGCLSIPGIKGYVERPSHIIVNYQDETAQHKSIELSGFLATVFQHELDHLTGTLYIDRIRDTKMLAFNEEFQNFHFK